MSQQLLEIRENHPDYSADNFYVSPSNIDAFSWVKNWPDWPSSCLFISGPAFSGKTHLTEIWKEKTGAILLDREKLDYRKIDGKSCYIIDNIITTDEEQLFHILNKIKETNSWLLLTSDLPFAQMNLKLADLKSRLAAALNVSILNPDDELLEKILIKHFSDRQLRIEKDVMKFLVPRLERSFLAVRNFTEKVDMISLVEKRNITVPFVSKILEGMATSPD